MDEQPLRKSNNILTFIRISIGVFALLRGLVSLILLVATLTNTASYAAENFRAALSQAVAQGHSAHQRGDLELALTHLENAVRQAKEHGTRSQQAEAMMYLGEVYQSLGQHTAAVQILNTAISIDKGKGSQKLSSRLMAGLGRSYAETGDPMLAREWLDKSIASAQKNRDFKTAASALNSLGNLKFELQQYPEAVTSYQESIMLSQQDGNLLLQALATVNKARARLKQGNSAATSKLLTSGLKLANGLPDSHDKAYLLINAARQARQIQLSAENSGRPWLKTAYDTLKKGEKVGRTIGDKRAVSFALGYQGQLYEETKRYDDALKLTNQAVFIAQEIRAPDVLYRWQWQRGRLLNAKGDIDAAIDAYREAARNLQLIRYDITQRHQTGRSTFRDVVGPLFFELADLLLRRPQMLKDETAIQNDLRAARAAVEQFKAAELEDYFGDDCVAELQSKTIGMDQLTDNTVVLYPILLPDRMELLLSLPNGIKQVTVPVTASEVTEETRRFRRTLEKRTTRQYLRHAKKLYTWLIKPLEEQLTTAEVETLVVVPDGPLRTIPFGALHDGGNFLIKKYALAYTPGLFLTDPHPLSRENIHILLSGLTESVQNFPPLPHVDSELHRINHIYRGKILLNRDYLVHNVREELERTPYTIVHIASHGRFSSDAKQSFLLAYDGKVTMDRLERFMGISRFRDQPIELISLSACETAAGDDRAALGLAGVAVKAGARSALATLWSVADQSTSLLVSDFYNHLKNPSISKAKAIQQAQIKILNERRYRHPSYWSPFILIGNWL